jgi:hypothetical protein
MSAAGKLRTHCYFPGRPRAALSDMGAQLSKIATWMCPVAAGLWEMRATCAHSFYMPANVSHMHAIERRTCFPRLRSRRECPVRAHVIYMLEQVN